MTSTKPLKVSGVARVDDPLPRLRFEWSGIVFLDAEDLAALNDLMALPGPPPPLFTKAEMDRHAAEFHAKRAAEAQAKADARAAEIAKLREQFPTLVDELLPSGE